jgi:hypothetical protein
MEHAEPRRRGTAAMQLGFLRRWREAPAPSMLAVSDDTEAGNERFSSLGCRPPIPDEVPRAG